MSGKNQDKTSLMKTGDIVKVRLKESAGKIRVGILLEEPRERYMAPGYTARVWVDSKIYVVMKEHLEVIK